MITFQKRPGWKGQSIYIMLRTINLQEDMQRLNKEQGRRKICWPVFQRVKGADSKTKFCQERQGTGRKDELLHDTQRWVTAWQEKMRYCMTGKDELLHDRQRWVTAWQEKMSDWRKFEILTGRGVTDRKNDKLTGKIRYKQKWRGRSKKMRGTDRTDKRQTGTLGVHKINKGLTGKTKYWQDDKLLTRQLRYCWRKYWHDKLSTDKERRGSDRNTRYWKKRRGVGIDDEMLTDRTDEVRY